METTKRLLIELQVESFVKKWVHQKFNRKHHSTVELTIDSLLGSMVRVLLEEKPSNYKKPKTQNSLKVSMTLRNSHNDIIDSRCKNYFISEKNSSFINRTLKKMMEYEIFTRISSNENFSKMNIEIRKFQAEYSIQEDEMSYERIKKAYYRWRNSDNSL